MKKYEKPELRLISFQSARDIADDPVTTSTNQTSFAEISAANIINY
ncbi:MAG: hypothetical protein LUD77_04980 [Clostridiales bacterium]|nr:hypothetical protein [Clostridiales bacterium]